MIQQFWKGKVKGQIQGKDGGKGVCWSCGESDHHSRDCPSNKHDDWTDLTSWKDQHHSGFKKSSATDGTWEGSAGSEERLKGRIGRPKESRDQRKGSKEAMERKTSTTLMRPVKVIGGRNLTAQVQKTIFTSASRNVVTGDKTTNSESIAREVDKHW